MASGWASSAATGRARARCLRLLARIYPPTVGTVEVRGNVAPLIEMGAGFNPELSGLDNILSTARCSAFPASRCSRKVDRIHEFTGLREFADLPLKYYSSGMYMRLAFAIATEIDPEILLIDEALGVGDAAFQTKAKHRIPRFWAGRTRWCSSRTTWIAPRSCAPGASGSATVSLSPTARSTPSSMTTWPGPTRRRGEPALPRSD